MEAAVAAADRGVGPTATRRSRFRARRASLRRLAVEAFREGCVGETLAVGLAAARLSEETDPAVRAVLERIVTDESRHAELAWDVVRWAIASGGPRVRAAVAREARAVRAPAGATPAEGRALRIVVEEVVAPAAAELLAA